MSAVTTISFNQYWPINVFFSFNLTRDHEIDEEIETPARDHIKFPGLEESRLPIQKRKLPISDTRRGKTIVFRGSRENVVSKKGSMPDDLQGKSAAKVSKSFERSSSDGKLLGKVTAKSLWSSESKNVKLVTFQETV